jgi:putative SOS response-associated peptidase YedK
MYIRMRDRKPFAFAGLWETWCDGASGSEASIRSCTIITVDPNELLKPIHNRMPAIVQPSDYNSWLEPKETPSEQAMPMLAPYPAERMEAFEVGRTVNNPSNDVPGCIEPFAGPAAPPQAPPHKPPSVAAQTRSRRRQKNSAAPGLFGNPD